MDVFLRMLKEFEFARNKQASKQAKESKKSRFDS